MAVTLHDGERGWGSAQVWGADRCRGRAREQWQPWDADQRARPSGQAFQNDSQRPVLLPETSSSNRENTVSSAPDRFTPHCPVMYCLPTALDQSSLESNFNITLFTFYLFSRRLNPKLCKFLRAGSAYPRSDRELRALLKAPTLK